MPSRKKLAFVGEFQTEGILSSYTVDGRFLFFWANDRLQILDIFHSKTRFFNFQAAPNMTVDGYPQKCPDDEPELRAFYPIDSNTVLVVYFIDRMHYWGVGRIDYEHSVVLIERMVRSESQPSSNSWLPLSYPANLNDGVLCRAYVPNTPYWTTNILFPSEDENKLRHIDFMNILGADQPFAFRNGFFYVLSPSFPRPTVPLPAILPDRRIIGVDLKKIDISTGKRTREPTKNWEPLNEFMTKDVINPFTTVAVGKRLFKSVALKSKDKNSIFMLDTDSLEWRKMISFNRRHISCTSDGTRALIACVETGIQNSNICKFYRFVFEPEKLSTLVWLRLKRIFDARPSAYEFILSKVPVTIHLKHTPL